MGDGGGLEKGQQAWPREPRIWPVASPSLILESALQNLPSIKEDGFLP